MKLKNPITTILGWVGGGSVLLSSIDWAAVVDINALLISLQAVDGRFAILAAVVTALGINAKDGERKPKVEDEP